METYYLIDYENVGSTGVSKCSGLGKTDRLIIFYTENSKKIDLDIIDNHGEAVLETQKVPTKSQSVDMHIVSYMGYLIGRYEGMQIKIIIISKDKDYDNLIKYRSTKAQVERKQRIEGAAKKKEQSANKTEGKNTSTATKKSTNGLKKAPTKSEIKTKLNAEIQKILSQNGYPQEIINGAAKLATKNYGNNDFKQQVHNEMRRNLGDSYDEVYKLIKPVLTKYS